MVLQVDEAVELYREQAKFPEVKFARVCNSEAPGHVQVYSQWTQRDLEKFEKVTFSKHHFLQLDVVVQTCPHEVTNELWNQESPSGKYRAVVRSVKDKKGEDKQYVEVWTELNKLHSVDVTALDRHGKICAQDSFGCLVWSHSETKLLYVAERKRPKTKSFFDKKATDEKDASAVSKGDEFVFQEEWGEQHEGVSHPVLCILEIEAGTVTTLDCVPEDVSPGRSTWCSGDVGVVCEAYWHTPYRLGIIYCPIRRSALFHIDLKSQKCTMLTSGSQAVRSPVFSLDHTKLVYLENTAKGPHFRCSKLMMCDWATKGIVPVLDIVRKQTGMDDFPGIFTLALTSRCWAEDNRRLILDTQWRSATELVVVDCEEGTVTKLTNDSEFGAWRVLDVHKDLVLAERSAPDHPQQMVLGQLPAPGSEQTIQWTILDPQVPRLTDISWTVHPTTVPPDRVNPQFADLDYEYYVMQPTERKEGQKFPLVVYCHGGPHTAFSTDYNLYFSLLCRCGYMVLLVNYRGSTGFGQDSIDSLVGNIGTQEIQDVQSIAERLVKADDRVNPEQVVVTGGSHGGFITAHLIGQYPDFYKAAVIRNPAIDVNTKSSVTDIVDVCFAEAGFDFDFKYLMTDDYRNKGWECSPLRLMDKVKTPMMILLGADDKRVHPSQGHQYRKYLQARGIPVRTHVYPGNSHPLNKVEAEADIFINIIRWFQQHLKL